MEDETKFKIHFIAVSETQDEAKEGCFGGDDSRRRVQQSRTERDAKNVTSTGQIF